MQAKVPVPIDHRPDLDEFAAIASCTLSSGPSRRLSLGSGNSNMSPPNASPATLAQWHAVTPLTRPLSIAILELAPTSVTLALTRSPPTPSNLTPAQQLVQSHAHHAHSGSASPLQNGHGSGPKNKKKKKRSATSNLHQATTSAADSEDGAEDDGEESGSHGAMAGSYSLPSLLGEGQTFKDMLSHGVVVTLDGMPWSRIVAHVSDDEADGEGSPWGAGDDQDDDGEWEDDWEPAGGTDGGAEGGHANTTSSSRPAARRRRRKGARGTTDTARAQVTRPIRTKDTQDRTQRWDRERAVVVVYDLDPSQEHEIELQIVGLAGEIKDNGKLFASFSINTPQFQCPILFSFHRRSPRRPTFIRGRELTPCDLGLDHGLDQTL